MSKDNVYASALQTKKTPQSKAIPGREKEMVKNNAGGYTFTVTPFTQLERFLILGSDKPTYYTSAQKLTKDNAENIRKCLQLDGRRTVDIIVEISEQGRAPKNDPALFALAVAASPAFSTPETVQYALSQLSRVARTGTFLMQFSTFVDSMRGWGRSLKRAEGEWYTNRTESELAHTLIKYQNRDGWSNRDLLRLSHVKVSDPRKSALLAWSTRGGLDGLKIASETWGEGMAARAKNEATRERILAEIPVRRKRFADAYTLLTGETANRLVTGYEAAKKATSATEVVRLIREYGLQREMIPTNFLNSVEVWEALLEKMPITALVRNLGKMSSIGLLKPLTAASKHVVKNLNDSAYIRKGRLHPLKILIAQGVYRSGQGVKGNLTWDAVPAIVDALEDAFYGAFANVTPTGKNIYIGHDVSGSMSAAFTPGCTISCAQAGAAMGLVFARTEKDYASYGFASGRGNGGWSNRASGLVPLGITAKDTLESATRKAQMNNWGGTDCSLPMRHAQGAKMDVDAFIVITDNDTWAGDIQPIQALRDYRSYRNVQDVKLIVMGMTATPFTIADPTDPFNLDVVGFDAAAPAIVTDFIRGGSAGSLETDEE